MLGDCEMFMEKYLKMPADTSWDGISLGIYGSDRTLAVIPSLTLAPTKSHSRKRQYRSGSECALLYSHVKSRSPMCPFAGIIIAPLP
jgi:hypothetical protein